MVVHHLLVFPGGKGKVMGEPCTGKSINIVIGNDIMRKL